MSTNKNLKPKYNLVGIDGNAFCVMGYVTQCMKREKFTHDEIKEYTKQAMSSDYNNLLCVSLDYVEKCNEKYFNRNI